MLWELPRVFLGVHSSGGGPVKAPKVCRQATNHCFYTQWG